PAAAASAAACGFVAKGSLGAVTGARHPVDCPRAQPRTMARAKRRASMPKRPFTIFLRKERVLRKEQTGRLRTSARQAQVILHARRMSEEMTDVLIDDSAQLARFPPIDHGRLPARARLREQAEPLDG